MVKLPPAVMSMNVKLRHACTKANCITWKTMNVFRFVQLIRMKRAADVGIRIHANANMTVQTDT